MSKKLAIKGHPTRGKEVIELLEMLGGINDEGYIGTNTWKDVYYYLDNGHIRAYDWCDAIKFTLEGFWEKYPFKVGDKVIDEADGCPGVVSEMKWDEGLSDMKYCVAFGNGIDFGWYANDSINFFKIKKDENLEETQSNQDIDKVVDIFRKEFCECCGSQRCSGQDDELVYCERFKNLMDNSGKPSVKNHKMGPKSKLPLKYYEDKLEEIQSKREYDELRMPLNDNENNFPLFEPMFKVNDELEYKIPDGYEITEVSKDTVFIKPIKSKYPTTYAECCEIIHSDPNFYIDTHLYSGTLETLYKLLICRTAYRKIAGEEMGLDKPWEPKFGKTILFSIKFYLYQDSFILHKGEYSSSDNCILVFPTEKMRDAFYENFKDLIEQCKELL